jgi:Family of unknown function (DUF5681)
LSQAIDEKVMVTEEGRRRRIAKRELVIKQLVNRSASADLRAIKQLTDIVQGVERRAGASEATPAAARLHHGGRGGDRRAQKADGARRQSEDRGRANPSDSLICRGRDSYRGPGRGVAAGGFCGLCTSRIFRAQPARRVAMNWHFEASDTVPLLRAGWIRVVPAICQIERVFVLPAMTAAFST